MARIFNGTSDHIEVASASVSFLGNTTQDYSIFWWMHSADSGSLNAMIDKTDIVTPADWVLILLHNTNVHYQTYDGTTNPIVNPVNAINDDVWHSIVADRDAGTDIGARIDDSETTADDSGNIDVDNAIDFSMGSREAGTDRFYDGELAYVAVWNVLLSANEYSALANGVNPFVIRNSSLQLYCPLDGNNSPENNYASPTNTGTLTGTSKFAGNPPVQLLSRYL